MSQVPSIAKRAAGMQASPLRKLAAAAEVRKKEGVHVYHLNIGQPDIPTHSDVFVAVRSFDEATLSYAPSNGLPETLEAWSTYYKYNDIDFSPAELVITTGGSEAIIFALEAVCDPEDEVIVFEPFYTNYNGFATLTNVNLAPVTLDIKDGFHLPPNEKIEAQITDRTKAILVCNPSNPTGTIFTEEELKRLADIAEQHGLFVIADEVYREFSYERKFTSMMSYPNIHNQVIMVDSTSKRFNVCGARIGVLASKNVDVIAAAFKMGMARLSVASIEQRALTPLLNDPKKYVNPIVEEFRRRREIVNEGLAKVPNITFSKPEGAFYIIIGLPVDDADDFAAWMINEFEDNNETVLLAPAAGFYASPGMGKSEVRLAFMLKEKDLKRSLELLAIALDQYNK